ncbi:MAG: hypothetical protein AB8G23_08060 [Myxococcota bacterium]
MSEYPSIAQLIPHRDPMILLDEMLEWSKGRAQCGLVVKEGARFVEEGVLATPFLMEHMAQAVAVCLGYEAFKGGRGVTVGMIVSCRTFNAHVAEARVGDRLVISAEQKRANASVSAFDCGVDRISGSGEVDRSCIAEATLTLFHGDLRDPPREPVASGSAG